jgi:hypothetical protein
LGASMLSETAVRQAKGRDKDYKLSDCEGLYSTSPPRGIVAGASSTGSVVRNVG